MKRNDEMNFLGTRSVISLLDGDQRDTASYQGRDNIIFIPIREYRKRLISVISC